MTDIEVIVDATTLDDLGATYANIVPAIRTIAQKSLEPGFRRRVAKVLRPYPPPIKPGVFKKHATPAQRRAVMAKIRRGEWTGRTGKLGKSWYTQRQNIPNGAEISIGNSDPKAVFVVGERQQAFHTETGWIRANSPMEGIALEMAEVFYLDLEGYFGGNVRTVR